jgi:hypothetical protein
MLRNAGFQNVHVDLKTHSTALVQGWSPGGIWRLAAARDGSSAIAASERN